MLGRTSGRGIAVIATALALLCLSASGAMASVAHKADAFTAHGSAEQVYVTGVDARKHPLAAQPLRPPR